MSTLIQKQERHILKIGLNRPDLRNALSTEMIHELRKVIKENHMRRDLRAIMIYGEGAAFCAGADLQNMKAMVNLNFEENIADAMNLHELFAAIADSEVPVVCQVHGACFGGALGLMAASDIVIAESQTKMCFSEVKLGLAPALISEFVLRKTTVGKVAPWMLSGLVFSAEQAEKMGLVHFVTKTEDLNQQTELVLQSFREAGPESVRETKKLISKVSSYIPANIKQTTAQVIAERRVSAEGQEGLLSFLEKRQPTWRVQ